MLKNLLILIILVLFSCNMYAQTSTARKWNEMQIEAIRLDLARPPVQARNLYHVSLAMYEAWAAYNPVSDNYLLGHTIGNQYYPFPTTLPLLGNDTLASQKMAISYAAYRILRYRYRLSPGSVSSLYRFDTLMLNMGYDTSIKSTNFSTGTPAELGNHIAEQVLRMGNADGSREAQNHSNAYYAPINPPLPVADTGARNMLDLNRWQPLYIVGALDQNNQPINPLQKALCHEWGNVLPFALDSSTATLYQRDGNNYRVYMDPGGPSTLDTLDGTDSSSLHYKWANVMVSVWSSFLDPSDTTMIDISPRSRGNIKTFPTSLSEQYNYYNFFQGGDPGTGHPVNPVTGLPYNPHWVKRGDYTRVISQYWADGPTSETPPGHWFVILNKVSDHPMFVKKWQGVGDVLSPLEWDVKSYLTLGGALHDAAIAAWSLKGWYDSPRPISAIRKMAHYGQSSDSTLPSYHKAGLPLIPGYVELILPGDSLALLDSNNLYKIKLKSWKGFSGIVNPLTHVGGVGWILAENWIPYQRKTFVTPPFAGFVSGHSTYSRTGAEIMTSITGSEYFPGGIYQTYILGDNNFLIIEKGPSTDVRLQWATYQDASNEASLSRIYGGIHPPTDDGFGRYLGTQVANSSFLKANGLFNAFVLPANLVSFEAVNQNCTVSLYLKMEGIDASKSYEIWRRNQPQEPAVKLTTLSVQSEKKEYKWEDLTPNEFNEYELREVETPHKYVVLGSSYSRVFDCNPLAGSTKLIPNHVLSEATLVIANKSAESQANISVVDMLGRVIYHTLITLNGEETEQTLKLGNLLTGHYILKVQYASGEKEMLRFSKN